MGDMALPAGQAWHPMGGTSGRPRGRSLTSPGTPSMPWLPSMVFGSPGSCLSTCWRWPCGHRHGGRGWPACWSPSTASTSCMSTFITGGVLCAVLEYQRPQRRPGPGRGRQPGLRVPLPARDRRAAGGRRGDQVDGAARPRSRDRPWGGRRAQPARAESSAPLSWPLLAHPIRYVWDSAAGRQVVPAGNPLLYGPWLVIPSTRLLFDMLPAGRPVHGPGAGSVWGWAWPRCWPRWRTRRSGPICRYPSAGCGSSRSSAF
jgi:hypothetical protein